MARPKIWSIEKLTEMEKWLIDNKSNLIETAKHFGIEHEAYRSARNNYKRQIPLYEKRTRWSK